jgi:hypothetical protein
MTSTLHRRAYPATSVADVTGRLVYTSGVSRYFEAEAKNETERELFWTVKKM